MQATSHVKCPPICQHVLKVNGHIGSTSQFLGLSLVPKSGKFVGKVTLKYLDINYL